MENYFNYFTQIEEHFQRRRGTTLLLSTLDWALIETWKDAGIPLAAVLRGIDSAFDAYDARPRKTRKVNSLAYCSQEVLAAAEDMKEAATGAPRPAPSGAQSGLEATEIALFLQRNAAQLERATLPPPAAGVARGAVARLRQLADQVATAPPSTLRLEDLERQLTVVEEKLWAAIVASTEDRELVSLDAEADRAIAPYRRKMSAAQIAQLQKQFVRKQLFQQHGLPRLSLFYM